MTKQNRILPKEGEKYRLITRSDMDGLVCALLLKDLDLIDNVAFAHPKDMQDGKITVTDKDITTNLPYVNGVFLSFDHHSSEVSRLEKKSDNHIMIPDAPSAARVVYDYFGGAQTFPNVSEEIMMAVDKADSGNFTKDDVLDPQKWELLSFIMDARTGLGRFHDFNISNHQLMMDLIDHCHKKQNIDEILALPDVKERVDLYKTHHLKFREQLERCARIEDNVVIIDLRNEDKIWAGNRFMVYALFPNISVSVHVIWGKNKQNTVIAAGKSIFNKTSNTKIGELMLQYGGGGHAAAGTCQIENLKVDTILKEIVDKIIQSS